MKFSPKTKEELATMNIVPPGHYAFRVTGAKDKTSRNGRDMIELMLEIDTQNGSNGVVFDYLLEAMPQKLFAFCEATGMSAFYHQGSLTSNDCIGKSAYLELTIEQGQQNPQGGYYPDKNSVKKYIAKAEYTQTRNNPNKSQDEEPPFIDDNVPF